MIQYNALGYRLLLLGSILFSIRVSASTTEENGPAAESSDDGDRALAATATSDTSGENLPSASAEPEKTKGAKTTGFEEIEVRGESSSHRIMMQAQSIGTLSRPELERNTGLFLDESINLLPGVRLENRTVSGGQRITIRGYGNGTNFNGTGYKAYLNGIPITDAEGTTILDDIDFSTLGRVEVIKGPASSLYGSGIAGVLKMYTLRPEPNATRFTQELIGGTQTLFRTNTRVELGTDNSSVLVNYGHQHSDGYRIHSQSNKDYVLLSADVEPNTRQSLSVYGAFNKSVDQLAGQLTEEQFNTRQNVGEPAYLANDAHVGISSIRFGASHSYEFHPVVNNVTSAYASGYQLDQPFAGGRTDNLALNFGGRTAFNLRFGGPGFASVGVIGGEIQQTNSFKKSYNLNDGILGGIRGDLQVIALQASTFTQWDFLLPYEFTLTAGASLNFVHYNIQDRLANSANPSHADQSGVKDFTPVISPRVALLKAFGRHISIYGQVSQGYTPPGSGSVVIPQIGAVNTNLKPERATLYELGTKGNLIEGRFSYEIALFDMLVKDKLTTQAVTNDAGTVLYNYTTNAGSQSNRGLEVAAKYSVINDKSGTLSLLQPFVGYTLSHFRYTDFKSDNNNNANTVDYSGNKVVGVPMNLVNVGFDLALRWGIYLYGTYQYVDSMPLTYDNAHSAKSYSLLNAKVGYRPDLGRHFQLDVFAGGNNLLGNLYYTMVFLNASYVDSQGRPIDPNVYLPGPYSATFYGGVNLSYSI
jgi:iron complex outermembrane receptor protein